jgi:hypothetical protein
MRKKAERYFGRTLSIARAQQAKSWELRGAMSMARLWRDQGERDPNVLAAALARIAWTKGKGFTRVF